MPEGSVVVRSLPYPVLEAGNLSYPHGEYRVEPSPRHDGRSAELRHHVVNAPLVETMLREGRAVYACLVSVPRTGYRKLEQSSSAVQVVRWDLDQVGEPPLLQPVILAADRVTRAIGPGDGVARAWQGRTLTIPAGARLARAAYLRAVSSRFHMLRFRCDPSMSPGSFRVEECAEEGYYFLVRAASDLFTFVQQPQGHVRHRGSVLTHMVGRCLELLTRPREDGDAGGPRWWDSHRNLQALADELKQRELGHWDDDDFPADEVSSRLHPHEPPPPSDD